MTTDFLWGGKGKGNDWKNVEKSRHSAEGPLERKGV